jgi:hypothetical protein
MKEPQTLILELDLSDDYIREIYDTMTYEELVAYVSLLVKEDIERSKSQEEKEEDS